MRFLSHLPVVGNTSAKIFLAGSNVTDCAHCTRHLDAVFTSHIPEWHLDMAICMDKSNMEQDPQTKSKGLSEIQRDPNHGWCTSAYLGMAASIRPHASPQWCHFNNSNQVPNIMYA